MAAKVNLKLTKVYLSLGSNLGDRLEFLRKAAKRLSVLGLGMEVSPLVESEAWGYEDPRPYINCIASLETVLPPASLLESILDVERSLGRSRISTVYEARTIDIDIIYFGNEIVQTPDLMIPHPAMARRRFVLMPLCSVAPEMVHPVLNKTNAELLHECTDETRTEWYADAL